MKTYDQFLREGQSNLILGRVANLVCEHDLDPELIIGSILEDLIRKENDPERLRLLNAFYSEDMNSLGSKIGGLWGGFKSGLRNFSQSFQQGHNAKAPEDLHYGPKDVLPFLQKAMEALQLAGFGPEVIKVMQQIVQKVQTTAPGASAPASPAPAGSEDDAKKAAGKAAWSSGLSNIKKQDQADIDAAGAGSGYI